MLQEAIVINKKKHKHYGVLQKGLSLIEASMVLILSAIVVSGTVAYYQAASDNTKLDKTTQSLMHIMTEVKGAFITSDAGYKGIDVATLQTLMPEMSTTMVNDPSGRLIPALMLPYPGSNLLIQAGKYNSGNNTFSGGGDTSQFQLTMKNLPLELCMRIMGFNFGKSLVAKGGRAVGKGVLHPEYLAPNASMTDVTALCDKLAQSNPQPTPSFGRATANYYLIFQ